MYNKIKWALIAMILSSNVVNAAERDFTPQLPHLPRLRLGRKSGHITGHLVMNAKMDTGALTSSLDAKGLTSFQRDGKDWVRFDVETQG